MGLGGLLFTLLFYMTSLGNCLELNLKDKESIQITLPEEKVPTTFTNKGDKVILRYGFHRTQECQQFNKAFICIRKCLDLGYQIAHSDKACKCTCYKNKILAKYQTGQKKVTSWKLGAPTTSLPRWGLKGEPMNDTEINANYPDYEGQTKTSAPSDVSTTQNSVPSEEPTSLKSETQADTKEESSTTPASQEQTTQASQEQAAQASQEQTAQASQEQTVQASQEQTTQAEASLESETQTPEDTGEITTEATEDK